MTLEEKLRSKHQGLPGLGVDASSGADGRRGRSIYIGHVKDFFDGIMLTEEEKGYIRIKNQKHYRLPENRQFYYKKQSNFYRALADEVKRMTTFSIYNLHGMYLKPGKVGSLELGSYDFARFGWALDLHRLIKHREGTLDPAISKFNTWLKSKTTEELRTIDGKLFIEGSEAGSEEDDTDSSMLFKYMSLNRSVIGDPSYPNPYSVTDFDNAVFNVHLGNFIDDPSIDVNGIDYLRERELNQSQTNYNTKYTPDVLIPTNLSSKYKEGDVLYLLDDVTDEIFAYIVVNGSMVECRYDYFLTLSPVPIKSLLSPFKDGERVGAYKNLVLSDLEIADAMRQYKNNAVDNFIKKYDNNYSLSLVSNKENEVSWIRALGGNQETKSTLEVSSSSSNSRAFTIKTDRLKLDNIAVRDIWTNMNVPEYFNTNIILVDGLHVDNIDEREFIDEYKKISVSSSKFFYSSKDGDEFGVMFIGQDGKLLKTYKFREPGSYTIPYVEDLSISGATDLRVMTYAREYGTTKYYSDMSDIHVDIEANALTYTKNGNTEEIQDIYDNDFFSFNTTSITCEDCEFDVVISASEGVVLEKVLLNEEEISASMHSSKWVTMKSFSASEDMSQASMSLVAQNNLPNEGNIDQTSIVEYLKAISHSREIGEKIQETTSREAIITAVGHRVEDGQKVRTSYRLIQPGFENPLKDINIEFENLIDNNAIENSNSSVNGVLCNQVQVFTEVGVVGFTPGQWGTYLEDPKLYIYLNIDNDIDNDIDTDESNFNNVHFYSINDKNKFANNAVRMDFSWIPNREKTSHDSSVCLIEEREHEFSRYAYVFGDINDSAHIDSEWVYLSDKEFLRNKDTYIPKDIIYRLDDGSCISEVSLEDAARSEKIKIRTHAEIANPVPMEFNVKWIVEKIEVRGKVKRDYYARLEDNTEEDTREELVFTKRFVDSDGFTFNPVSQNVKLVINPVYMTACHEASEDIRGTKIGVAIMNIGDTAEPKVRIGIQDIDQEAKDEFFLQKRYDLAVNRLKESRGNYNYVSDITYYWPKKRYLQDNIQNIFIKPRDLKGDILSKSITKKVSPFVRMIDEVKSKESILQNMYNISLLDPSSTINDDFSKSFLMSLFNGYAMNPEYRNEVLSFYYNNDLYLEKLYDQWNSISPLWSQQEATIEVVDASLLEAKHIWNYEYEVSEDYIKGKAHGGVVTKSGDGYLELSTEDAIEKYDTGQYNAVGSKSLKDTLQETDAKVMPEPVDIEMSLPSGFTNMPEPSKFFRTMIFDMKWIYPYFININNTLMVYPYYFANSYESWIDASIMEGHLSTRKQDSVDELKTYISNSDLFFDEESREEYLSLKFDESLYLVKNNYLVFETSTEKTKINMLMPYNVCYDIYPRTMYNTDCRNTVNVFMLQQPSIVTEDSFALDKHYFKIPPFNDDEVEKDYYATKFEDGKQVVAPILPPWYFNK